MEPLCRVKGLEVKYSRNGSPVFSGVDIEGYRGEVLLIMGPNGGGKTTLLKAIIGLVKPSRGSIEVLGRDPYRDLTVRKLIGYVPQVLDFNLYAPLTLWDLVSLGRYPRLGIFKRFSEEDFEAVETAIKRVGLEDHVDRKVSELSGGQLSRALIARALAQEPEIYLLDEPFESIDYVSEEIIHGVLKEEASRGKLIIFTEHHIGDTSYIDRVILFNHGVVANGRPDEVMKEDVLRLAYGG